MDRFEKDRMLAGKIARRVADAGGRVYYVGGCVRDSVMGLTSKDVDIEVYGITAQKLREILSGIGEVMEKGASFGVLGLRHSDLDIAMPRTESCTGRGHTDFEVYVDPFLPVEKACMRRDLTMNAMLQDVLTGEIVDCYGGQRDIREGIIRCVNPTTFAEDPLRVFRACQFAARFSAVIEPDTLELCRSMDVTSLTSERIFGETEKALLKAGKPSVYFEELRRMNHLSEYYPEIEAMIGIRQNPKYHPEGDVFVHTMMVVDTAAGLRKDARNPLGFMTAALLHDTGKCVSTQVQPDGRITSYMHEKYSADLAEKQIRRWTSNVSLIRYVRNMCELHMRPNMLYADNSLPRSTRKLYDLSVCPQDLILLALADRMGRTDEWRDPEPRVWMEERLRDYEECIKKDMVTGQDLLDAGLQPGSVFRMLLDRSRQLHFSGLEKNQALEQVLEELRSGKLNEIMHKRK